MKILNIGSLNIDYVYVVPHHVGPGETIASLGRQVFPGGKGLNQTVAMAQAGASVRHGGAIGEMDGGILLQTLEQHGVDTGAILRRPCESGHAIIQVDANGQNCIITHGGANQTLEPGEVARMLEGYGAGDRLVLQNEIPPAAIRAAMELAAGLGMDIIFNPSPIYDGIQRLPLHLAGCLALNEVEAAVLTSRQEPEAQLCALQSLYPAADILLTLGSHGAVFAPVSGGERFMQPAYQVKVQDTTAAGDTFLGFFAALYHRGKDPRRAMQLAASAAALCVTRHGASVSIPSLEEALAFCQQAGATEGGVRG